MSDFVRYVIVVHGIGQQRKNETLLSVVSRFAEACRGQGERERYDVVTLGSASSQTGKEARRGACRTPIADSAFQPWLEFEGIPADGSCPTQGFLGKPGRDGENLRFADLCWADLMGDDFPDVGQPPDLWADGLLGRLWRKKEYADRRERPAERPPIWALDTLDTVRETLLLLYKLLGFRTRALRDTVFVDYLGDVQLYGEYLHLRGRAVRRFHRLMAHIERWHWEQERERVSRHELERSEMREPRYTILAHSLGTVMAMDAIFYAHASRDARLELGDATPNFPFPGYLEGLSADTAFRRHALLDHVEWSERLLARLREGLPLPGETSWRPPKDWPEGGPEEGLEHLRRYGHLVTQPWIRAVESFVTLGSPIDKYLTLWWQNYEYLTTTEWIDPGLAQERQVRKIRHFNYCDEQDPIGHNLDVARTAEAFQQVFEVGEDLVYNRFPVPGRAHTSYWKDLPLFSRILGRTICPITGPPEETSERAFIFDPAVYQKILNITYKWIPYSVVLAGLFALTLAWHSDSWHVWPVASLALAAVVLVGRRLLDLNVAWRQVLRLKWIDPPAAGEEVARIRKRKADLFKLGLPARALLYLGLTGFFGGLYLEFGKEIPWSRGLLIPMVALLGVFAVGRVASSFASRRDRSRAVEASPAPPADPLLGGSIATVYAVLALTVAGAAWVGFEGVGGGREVVADWGHWLTDVLARGRLATPVLDRRSEILFTLAAGSGLAAAVFGYLNWRFCRTKSWFLRNPLERPGDGYYRAYHGQGAAAGDEALEVQPRRPEKETEDGSATEPVPA